MKNSNKMLLSAAIAGIIGAGAASNAMAKDAAKKAETEKCYGINKCGGHGQCGGENSSCKGTNKCAGQGWINVIKGTCTEIKDGSLTPVKKS